MNYEIINDLSLLITVEGSKQDLVPYMLAAHFDVVPVVQDEWTYPGFGGNETADGTVVYGRGAIDDKSSLIVRKIIIFTVPFDYLILFHLD